MLVCGNRPVKHLSLFIGLLSSANRPVRHLVGVYWSVEKACEAFVCLYWSVEIGL